MFKTSIKISLRVSSLWKARVLMQRWASGKSTPRLQKQVSTFYFGKVKWLKFLLISTVSYHLLFFISFAPTAVAEWEPMWEGKFQEREMQYF